MPNHQVGQEVPRDRQNLTWIVVAAVVVVLTAVAVVLILRPDQTDRTDRQNQTGKSPATSSSPTSGRSASAGSSGGAGASSKTATGSPSSSSPSAKPKPTTKPDAIPAGFTKHKDPTGFTVAVPTGWTRAAKGTEVTFSDPKSRAYLLVDTTTKPKADALKDWKEQESYFSRSHAGYNRISLKRVDYRDWNAADWEFTWQASGGRLHVLSRNIRVSDKRAYALYWSVPADDWSKRKSDFDTIAKTFQAAK